MLKKRNILLLDCTLRDGGYINDWSFGRDNISFIIDNLEQSNVDFIEVGYLNDGVKNDTNSTKFNFQGLDNFNIKNSDNKICMIDFGTVNIDNLPDYDSSSNIRGIRLAFHRKDLKEALDYAKKLKEKGYLLFVQPMVTSTYSESELFYFLDEVNKIKPFAVYFVDSFGSMGNSDVKHLARLFDEKLDSNIKLGFHSHNNLQLSLSNAIGFIESVDTRDIIIDSSVYGMGRGAGNLATELIMKYLNDDGKKYNIDNILNIASEVLAAVRQQKYWGYSMEYYISAIYKCHPNYVKYLINRQTLSIYSVKEIISSISEDKKNNFDKDYIEHLYQDYETMKFDESESLKELEKIISGKKILLVGPGRSIWNYKSDIINFQKSNEPITIFINHDNNLIDKDYIFVNNQKRLNKLKSKSRLLLTSNLKYSNSAILFDYQSNLLNNVDIMDNSLLMLLNILKKLKVSEVYLAGFDGFTSDVIENYYDEKLVSSIDKSQANILNDTIIKGLKELQQSISMHFITPSIYNEGMLGGQ